jgi:hypothetical protein
MKYIMIGLPLLTASPALAQEVSRKFYNDKGRIVGSRTTARRCPGQALAVLGKPH